jgi:hypothetical protein
LARANAPGATKLATHLEREPMSTLEPRLFFQGGRIRNALLSSYHPGTGTRRARHFFTATITLLLLISIFPAITIAVRAGIYNAGTIALITKFHFV